MAQTTPPTITTPPTAPVRGDRSTFSARVDAFVTWLIAAVLEFAAVATNVYNNAVDAYNNAVSAAASAVTATTQATAAVSGVNAIAWVSGTTYALGDTRYSPLDFRTYRRITAGAGTTDPSLDTTNWLLQSAVSGMRLLATLTPTAASTVDFLTTLSASYDNYLVIGEGITNNSGSDDALRARFAVAGAVDSASNYWSQFSSFNYMPVLNQVLGSVSSGKGGNFTVHIRNANDPVRIKDWQVNGTSQTTSAPDYTATAAHFAYSAANAVSGFRLYWSVGSNFGATGKIRVYGYNNA